MKKGKPVQTLTKQIAESGKDPAPHKGKTRGKPEERFYRMTFKIPRQTYEKLNAEARRRYITLQGLMEEYAAAGMAADGIEGPFDPDEGSKQ